MVARSDLGRVRVETRRLADLVPAPYNPRAISDDALAGLGESIGRFGLVQPVIVNARTGRVVGGHQRLKVLQARGVEETDVVVVDLPEAEEKALNSLLQVKENQAVVQVATWMEQVRAGDGAKREPVGSWVVAEMPVGRGEFVGRKQFVKLPLWSSESQQYVLREVSDKVVKGKYQPRGWLVDFSTKSVLVDFEGGRVKTLTLGGAQRRFAWETGNSGGYKCLLAHGLDGGPTLVLLNNTNLSQKRIDEIAIAALTKGWPA